MFPGCEMQVPTEDRKGYHTKGIRFSGAEVIGHRELPDVSAVDQTCIPHKRSTHS